MWLKAIFSVYLLSALLFGTAGAQEYYRVLVVMSYEQENPWSQEVREGIESVFDDATDLHYLYMDTKVNLAGGQEKAAHAYALYQQLQPDGVITVDDNAQSMFVVPYLLNQVETPVMFAGVNARASQYGYPAANVSGILERAHVDESLAFLKQLMPEFERVCFVVNDSLSGRALEQEISSKQDDYLVSVTHFYKVKRASEFEQLSAQMAIDCDAVFPMSLAGIMNQAGEGLTHKRAFKALQSHYSGPFIGANRYHIEEGALSAVIKSGQEQGETAAGHLLQAMQGKPVAQIPIKTNYQGRRLINLSTLQQLNLQPRPVYFRGVELIKGR